MGRRFRIATALMVCATVGVGLLGACGHDDGSPSGEAIGLGQASLSWDCVPECDAIGTRSEGWYCDGVLVDWAQCAGCGAECDRIGTHVEGWYSSCDHTLIDFAECAELSHASTGVCMPYCSAISSKLEGWYCAGELVDRGACQGCIAECDRVGTRSEGWYSSCDDGIIERADCR